MLLPISEGIEATKLGLCDLASLFELCGGLELLGAVLKLYFSLRLLEQLQQPQHACKERILTRLDLIA